jgi:hypothetical protein
MSAAHDDKIQARSPKRETKGGYPAGDKPVSQLNPPPAGITGKQKIKKSA